MGGSVGHAGASREECRVLGLILDAAVMVSLRTR